MNMDFCRSRGVCPETEMEEQGSSYESRDVLDAGGCIRILEGDSERMTMEDFLRGLVTLQRTLNLRRQAWACQRTEAFQNGNTPLPPRPSSSVNRPASKNWRALL